MHRTGAAEWLILAKCPTYEGSSVELLLHGRRTGVHIGITRGIKQGCPASGSLWAIGYDPLIRCLLTLRLAHDLRAFVFADDIGFAVRSVAAFLAIMFPLPLLHARAQGCRDHPPLRQDGHTLLGGLRHCGDPRVALPSRWSTGCACRQTVVSGIDGHVRRWAAQIQKFLARVRHVGGLALSWTDRALAYRMLAQSLLRFMRQFPPPDGGVLRSEQAAVAMLVGAPMHSMGPGIAEKLSTVGTSRELGSIAVLAHAAQIALAIGSPDAHPRGEAVGGRGIRAPLPGLDEQELGGDHAGRCGALHGRADAGA